jgi:biofilm PGA synthesis lipoprotein PgaB
LRRLRFGFASLLLCAVLLVGCRPESTNVELRDLTETLVSHPAGQTAGGDGVAVLVFHEVSPSAADDPWVISPRELADLLDSLTSSGYTLVSPADFLAYLEGETTLPPRTVVITFDDGYTGVYLHGYPVLRERGLAAFLFPVAKWYSPYPRPEPARPHLTAQQTRELIAAGWILGGHTYDGHRACEGRSWIAWPLSGESLGDYQARAWADIQLMKLELERLGPELVDFAPPYGELSPELEALLEQAGIRRLWIQEERLNRPGEVYVARLKMFSVEEALARLTALFDGP